MNNLQVKFIRKFLEYYSPTHRCKYNNKVPLINPTGVVAPVGLILPHHMMSSIQNNILESNNPDIRNNGLEFFNVLNYLASTNQTFAIKLLNNYNFDFLNHTDNLHANDLCWNIDYKISQPRLYKLTKIGISYLRYIIDMTRRDNGMHSF